MGDLGKRRLGAFSDGVIAAITPIMVLEQKMPHGESLAAPFHAGAAAARLPGTVAVQVRAAWYSATEMIRCARVSHRMHFNEPRTSDNSTRLTLENRC